MKNKEKALIFLIITIFLIPSIVNASSTEIEEYYYTEHDDLEEWETDPNYMNDTNIYTYARTTDDSDSQLLTENQYTSSHPMGDIIRAYIQTMAFGITGNENIQLTTVIDEDEVDSFTWSNNFPTQNGVWSYKYDIEHPGHYPWQWADTGAVDIRVEPGIGSPSHGVSCSEVIIAVEYE